MEGLVKIILLNYPCYTYAGLESRNHKLWRITIGFGAVAALMGLALRYYFIAPLPVNFKYVLHGHSHVMLLGWLFHALILLLYRQWDLAIPKLHFRLIIAMNVAVLGMLLSFPFQGYALVSILFSTLHLWLSYILLYKIWRLSKGRDLPGQLVRAGIVFFFLSTIGPYSLGPLMANDMQSSPWYEQAIFFYLHFQYNGAFLFFLLAFIIERWLKPNISWPKQSFLWLMIVGTVLTWLQTLDFSFDSIGINLLGGFGALLQLVAGVLLLKNLWKHHTIDLQIMIIMMLATKWLFQLLGSIPLFADLVVENRFYFIAWLHFIFLGLFTPFIWTQLLGTNAHFTRLMPLYWTLFFSTEAVLILPSFFSSAGFTFWPQITFGLYAALVGVWLVFVALWLRSQKLHLLKN